MKRRRPSLLLPTRLDGLYLRGLSTIRSNCTHSSIRSQGTPSASQTYWGSLMNSRRLFLGFTVLFGTTGVILSFFSYSLF